MKVIFASYNPGKLREVRSLAEQYGLELSGISEAGVDMEFSETGETFEDNAKRKLEQALEVLPQNLGWVAADDSGISIDALGGEPGVKTRRWTGYEMTDEEITDMMLDRLKGVKYSDRTASMRTVVALGRAGVSTEIFDGELKGVILEELDKDTPDIPGFPDARLFYIPEIKMTYGQYVSNPEKARDFPSHRAKAFTKAFAYIKNQQTR